MCSILGAFTITHFDSNTVSNFKKSLLLMSYRGPDLSSELLMNKAMLGFDRLSIVGTKNGTQPIKNESSSIFLLCNGEIYNHREIKRQLHHKHQFSTETDCEVIIHLYEEDPVDFVSKLKGQFAFLIYDQENQRLVLGRDRFGINPLFYAKNGTSDFFIASEIKSILALDQTISPSLDPIGLKETLFLYGPTPPRTCFHNVFQVKPGYLVVVDLKKNKITHNDRYWKLPKEKARINFDKVQRQFFLLIKQAVVRRLQGDILSPAVYLSGGLDSATVAYLLSKECNKPVEAFSVTFQDSKFDESRYQKIICDTLRIPLFSIVGDDTFDRNFSQTIWHTEQPLMRTAPLPLYSLSEITKKQGHKYVLCGEGADEMLLGYPVFAKNLSSIEDKQREHSSLEKLFHFKRISGREMVESTISQVKKDWDISLGSVRQKQLIEIQTKLSRYLLVQQGDRQSMAHGVEQRFPFLDEDVVDFLFSLPNIWFKKFCLNKTLLRDTMRELLPKEIINREKQGYLAPRFEQMYKSKMFTQLIRKCKEKNVSSVLKMYFSEKAMKELISSFERKKLTNLESIGLLMVVSTYVLHDQFIGKSI